MNISDHLVEKELLLDSDPDKIVMVEPFIESFRSDNEVSDEIYGNLLVAVTEAVNNAIIHGNKMDYAKKVRLYLCRRKNLITCIIEDQGCGFDFANLPDPTAPENIENAGGRGVFLMKNLADLVIFSNDGSNVEIQFRL